MAAWMARLAQRTARRRTQGMWRRVHAAALLGMNIGGPIDPAVNGEAWLARTVVPAGGRVFDVGANVGAYARAVQAVVHGVRIDCFEPGADAYRQLAKVPGVTAWPLAFGASKGRAALHHSPASSELASLVDRGFGGDIEQVTVTTVDAFVATHEVDRIDLLKIDTEGTDLDVIRGARGPLAAGAIRSVQFEFGGGNITSRTFLRDFADALPGFTLHRLLPDGLVPIGPHERDEVFVMANYVALRT